MIQPLGAGLVTYVCVYCGQLREIEDDGTIRIVRPEASKPYLAGPRTQTQKSDYDPNGSTAGGTGSNAPSGTAKQ